MSYDPFFAAPRAVLDLMEKNKAIHDENLAQDVQTINMGKVIDFGTYEIWVYSRNEHLPSHVHIRQGNNDLGKISLYPTVEVIEPESSRIPVKDRIALVEYIKINRKKCQKEWNRLNGKPVGDPRNTEDKK